MKSLNLLPDQQKERLKKERAFLVVHGFIGVILVGTCLAATILTVARVILARQFTRIKQETSLVRVERLLWENNISQLNQKIARAAKIQPDFSKWTSLLSVLLPVLPANVTVDYLAVNRESREIKLGGRAANREALLDAKAALEKSSWLESLDVPLSNFLERINVEFRFLGKLKKF